MLPTSHCSPMCTIEEMPSIGKEQLADAFSAFMGAANRLQDSHSRLQREVEQLRRDLAERNAALATSRAENERMAIALQQILDGLPCGVAVVETATERVVLVNPAGRTLLDLAAAGSPSESKLAHWLSAAITAARQSPVEDGFEQEVSVERDGKARWLAIRATQLTKALTEQVVVIIRDVTGQKTAERERESARNLVALSEVSAVLAHEVRNPLGSLELLAQCLTHDPGLSGQSQQYVEHLQAGIRSLSATVNNALRFHTPGLQPMRPVPIATVLKSSVEFIRPLARQKKVVLSLREDLNGTKVMGDPEALKQVLLNLFSNALRHTAANGQICLHAHLSKGESARKVVIEFSDSGMGIKDEDLPRIFDAGFSTTGSSGLGLAVCSRILREHQGVITVNSQVGLGTTFQLELPAL